MLHSKELCPKNWTTSDIDTIFEEGDNKYVMIQDTNKHDHMLIPDITENVIYQKRSYKMKIHQVWSGTMDRITSE